MTELIIDGIQAVLPQSFTIQVKRENPLITKNGEYTYDVTLDLSNPVNAELYKHLNRLNSVAEVTTRRSAVLIADNRVYCNGTEVITGWTDKTVTIQIASGNSELNYIIGGDREIASLTTMPVTDPSINPLDVVEKTYPDTVYCLCPVYDQVAQTLANHWDLRQRGSFDTVSFLNAPIYAQPFLIPYIKEVVKALGYTMVCNQIEQTDYKKVYIVQVEHPSRWCEMLPGWTVNDFLTEIENLFNGVFVVDNRFRQVSFLFKASFYHGQTSAHVQDIDDIYEAEVVEKPDWEDMADMNVSYKAEDSDFWRWARLSDTVRKIAVQKDIPEDFRPDLGTLTALGRITAFFQIQDNQDRNTIYYDKLTDSKYLFTGIKEITLPQRPPDNMATVYTYRMVDRFADLVRGHSDTDIELACRPVTMAKATVRPKAGTGFSYDIELPVITANGKQAELSQNLDEVITNNESYTDKSQQPVSLAVYNGTVTLVDSYSQTRDEYEYPVPCIDGYITDYFGFSTFGTPNKNGSTVSLRLTDMDRLFYKNQYDIDFKHGIKLNSYDPNVYNPRQVFEIRNKRYICAEIEYTLDANGRKGAWTGTFYPIRISDTEADARWILTDGKWRDGGVWLDNGRWLDE